MEQAATPTVLDGVDAVRAAEGQELGTSPWIDVPQSRIEEFASATEDHQWIHVDVERADAESPFGTTIAHGYLTLALVNAVLPQVVAVEGFSMGVNYGLDRVRFPAPVPSGSRVRGTVTLTEVSEVNGGVQTIMRVEMQCDAAERPVCIADVISRYLH